MLDTSLIQENYSVEIHNKFRGDTEKVIKNVAKKNATKTINSHLDPKIEYIPTKDLEPLESQRITGEKWTEKRLIALGGLDMWAFGTLSVCRDPKDNINYVWDGCGRLALAQLHGLDIVPCVVIEGPKEQAAFYFGYNQDSSQGRRTLSKEVLFINRYFSGDHTAVKEANDLDTLGLYIKGDTTYPVPHPQPNGHVEIGYRAFSEGASIMNHDITTQRQVRDMIVMAWSNNPNGCIFINQDIYWALGEFLTTFPEAKKNGTNIALQHFLNNLAGGKDQKRIDWKPKGLSGNSGVSKQLATGLLKAFKESTYWKPNFQNTLTFKKLEA
jgi:hypothetical protein